MGIKDLDKSETERAQAAMEYLTTYGWAILIIAVISALLFLYASAPASVVPNTCNFVDGAYCNDMIVATNLTTHATTVAFFLTNTQKYPLANPKLLLQVQNTNTTAYSCTPKFILPGGSILCTVQVPSSSSIGSLLSGNIYFNATNCGLSPTYLTTHNCSNGVQQTYLGNFAGHAQPLTATKSTIALTAANYTQAANGNGDRLTATVYLLGYPLRAATVNFTTNNSIYSPAPNLTITASSGVALSSVSGSTTGTAKITAGYAGLSNSVVIVFTSPVYLTFLGNFTYCSTSGTIAYIDGTGYTCSQLSSTKFSFSKGTIHSYSFLNAVAIPTNTRESFKSLVLNQVPTTSNSGTLTVNSNITAQFNYYVQYYLTEESNPVGAGILQPGSQWYNTSTSVAVSEAPNSGYSFTIWTCTGPGCYNGPSASTQVVMNNPVTEIANYFLTTSTTLSSTSSSTSTTLSSTSTIVGSVTSTSTTVGTISSTSTTVSSTSTSTSTTVGSVTSTSTTVSSTSTSTSTTLSSTSTTIGSVTSTSTTVSSTSTSTSTTVSSTSTSTSTTVSSTSSSTSTTVSSTSTSTSTTVSSTSTSTSTTVSSTSTSTSTTVSSTSTTIAQSYQMVGCSGYFDQCPGLCWNRYYFGWDCSGAAPSCDTASDPEDMCMCNSGLASNCTDEGINSCYADC